MYTSRTKKLLNTNTEAKKNDNPTKRGPSKTNERLQFLNNQPMHGYQIITKIRKNFGVYFGPSTIYPLLATLEKKGHVTSEWNMKTERPRKIYKLTTEGHNLLNFTENSLNLLCQKIGTNNPPRMSVEAGPMPHFQKKAHFMSSLAK